MNLMAKPDIVKAVEPILEPSQILYKSTETEAYHGDWCEQFRGEPTAVFKPKTTEEVAEIIKACSAHGTKIIPCGGRSGLTGAVAPIGGEIVISLENINQIESIHLANQTVTVGAGCINQALQDSLAPYHAHWPIHLASSGSCQIGGNIATNAGGIQVIRYGGTRRWVMGLEYVDALGEIHQSHMLIEKDNTGFDISRLLIGSEGTLAIVTRATLKITAMPQCTHLFIFSIEEIADALAILKEAQSLAGIDVYAAEFFSHACLNIQNKAPLMAKEAPFYFLLELEGSAGCLDKLNAMAMSFIDAGRAQDVVVAMSAMEHQKLWSYREDITASLSHQSLVHKNDITVPLDKMSTFTHQLKQVISEVNPHIPLFLFGHVGDGNIHVNKLKPKEMDKATFYQYTEKMDSKVYQLVHELKGSISSEHGIGLLKKPYLTLVKTPAEIAHMRAIKHALDSQDMFNPGKLL